MLLVALTQFTYFLAAPCSCNCQAIKEPQISLCGQAPRLAPDGHCASEALNVT
jgi:hypothetical protein